MLYEDIAKIINIDAAIDTATDAVKLRVARLLKSIITNEGKRNDFYISRTKIPKGSIGRYIKLLKESELIEFVGESTLTGGYFLTNKLKNELNKK